MPRKPDREAGALESPSRENPPAPAHERGSAQAAGRRAVSKKRRLLFGLVAAIAGVVACLAALEVATRIINRFNLVSWGQWESHPGGGYKLSRHAEGMNAQGFRDIDRPFKKPPGVYRVLFFGDSFVWGTVDYEDNFPTLLERGLNDLQPERTLEIINLGVPGYGPADALKLWEGYGVGYEPDAVIYGFFYGNDITDNGPEGYHRAVLGERVFIRSGSLPDRSLLFVYLRTKWRLLRYNLTHEPQKDRPLQTLEDLKLTLTHHFQLFDPEKIDALRSSFLNVKGVLGRMAEFARRQGTPLFVLRYPSHPMVDRVAALECAEVIGQSIEHYDFGLPGRRVGELLAELSIPTGDIQKPIEAAQRQNNLYFDQHWNPEGNRAAAEAMEPLVYAFLAGQGLQFARPGAGLTAEN